MGEGDDLIGHCVHHFGKVGGWVVEETGALLVHCAGEALSSFALVADGVDQV